jgi:hypothetical protein
MSVFQREAEHDDDDDDNKPGWPTRAVGALCRSVRRIHINHGCKDVYFHIRDPSLRSRDILVKGMRF